ncbi:venom serine protease Bi-VSP-like [Zerene cesonia]|uniref:venom serine protease Bi-VSP-like n=1 Tax=Zerene cesonia TaxID=33412 RepID=UPI0018E541A1|nr:venom serine protease Bi-VSP-like [Zerene cesonia]
MYTYFIILLCACCAHAQYYYKRGQLCNEWNVTGTCKSILECSYAKKLVYSHKIQAPTCFYEKSLLIACCPKEFLMFRTGTFRDLFLSSVEGVKRSKDMTCRYDGNDPIVCCQNAPPPRVRDEPAGCPPLPRVYLRGKEDSHIAWQKCLENQRYTDKCVSKKDNPDEYERINTSPDTIDTYRIINGTDAAAREFPHMAALGCHSLTVNDTRDIVWVGGGSLISDKFILTAAHVVYEQTHQLIKYALLGTTNKTDIRDGVLYNILHWHIYELYSSQNQNNDIALVELDRKVVFSEFIRPACLPLPSIELENEAIVAGWGQTAQAGETSDILLKAQIELISSVTCIERIKKKNFRWSNETMICGRGIFSNRLHQYTDTCKGDSGGPVMAKIANLNSTYVVRGIVSFGLTCGGATPAAYTKVEPYINWIVDRVWPDEMNRRYN